MMFQSLGKMYLHSSARNIKPYIYANTAEVEAKHSILAELESHARDVFPSLHAAPLTSEVPASDSEPCFAPSRELPLARLVAGPGR